MAYTKYSLTPANNNATPPDGAPEGMLPSAVNDTMRDMMAQIRDVGDGIRNGTYTMTAPVITGGSITGSTINNSAIGGTTANSGAFTTLSASGVATFSAGTVSAPAITTTGDTNTGIYFPAADTIAFTEGGVESIRIDSSGKVGIGTSAPNALVTLNLNSSSIAGLQAVPTDGLSIIANTSCGITLDTFAANSQITFRRANGTITSPTAIQATNVIGSITGRGYGATGWSSGNRGLIQLVAGENWTDSAQGTYWQFNTVANGTTSSTEKMRIDPSGNVGIGTSSPTARLTVDGAVRIFGTTTSGYRLYVNPSTLVTDVYADGANTTLNTVTNGHLAFGTNNTERMRITSGGEVYIAGTTDQGAYNLQVNGTGVWGAGAYVNGSDERIKDKIAPLDSGLDVVAKLNPVTYKYKKDWSKDQSTQTGFIAQELLTALEGKNYVDGVVQQGGEYMSVAYQNIIPILTKAIQEQQAMIEELKQEVALLKSK